MNPLLRSGAKAVAIAGLVLLLLSGSSHEVWSQTDLIVESEQPERFELTAGKSILLRTSDPVKRVSIANLDIADLNLLSPREIYITGKTPGITNITLWHGGDLRQVYDLVVTADISRLKQQLHEILPDEEDIRVISFDEAVTLTGRVSSTAKHFPYRLSRRLSLYIPESDIN